MDSTICRYKHLVLTTHSVCSPTPAPLLTAVDIGILTCRDTKHRDAVEGVQRLEKGRGKHRQLKFRMISHILNRHHLHDIVEQTTLCLLTPPLARDQYLKAGGYTTTRLTEVWIRFKATAIVDNNHGNKSNGCNECTSSELIFGGYAEVARHDKGPR